MRTLLLMVISSAVAAALVFFWLRANPAMLGVPEAHLAPARGDEARPVARTAVSAVARLEPASEIIDVGAPAGMRLGQVLVKENDAVKAGAPVAYLDSHAEMEAAVAHAKKMLEDAHRRHTAETQAGQAMMDAVRARIRQADEGPARAIEAQEAEVRRCQAELEKAQLDLSRASRMHRDRALPKNQVDDAALRVSQTGAQLAAHRAKLAHMKAERELNIGVLNAQLKESGAAMVRAQVATMLDSMAAAIKVAQERLERTVIRAPMSGQVLKVMMHGGETVGHGPIFRLGDTAAMVAIAEVYETDVQLVKEGQTATITSRAFPGKITGKVERISHLVHKKDVLKIDPTSDADARVLEVRIKLDDSKEAAKFNYLQVDVSIGLASS